MYAAIVIALAAIIAGTYIYINATGEELGWWERSSAVTLLTSDQITADSLTVRLT